MKMNREKSIAMAVTILFFVSLGTTLYYYSGSNELNKLLNKEKLNTEKMLSQKLNLEKDIANLKTSITQHLSKNKNLDDKLAKMNKDLSLKETELKRLNSQHSSEKASFKKQIEELSARKKTLEGELEAANAIATDYKKKNDHLIAKVSNLESNESVSQNTTSSLRQKNALLNQIVGNNYAVEAHKRKEKLTINAKKTKEILLGFEIPVQLADHLTINVTNPDGVKLSNKNSKTISYNIDNSLQDEYLVASISDKPLMTQNSKRVAIKYAPTERFKTGIYQIDIYYFDEYLGSSQIRLK